nr:nucleoside triphosphate pyrophosphohydrolase [Bacillus piscicola]
MTVHNKLVRDKIPEVIERAGKSCTTTTLTEAAFTSALREKLQEEVAEYLQAEQDAEALEELADITELLHFLAEAHGGSMERVEAIRKDKQEQRGSFHKRLFLQEVHNK